MNEFLDKEAETLPHKQPVMSGMKHAGVIEVDIMTGILQRLPAMLRYTCRV